MYIQQYQQTYAQQSIFRLTSIMATDSKSTPPQDWVSPTYHLPTPTLDLDFRISCQLNPILRVGEGPWGQRNWISFQGGSWTAKWGRGTIEVRRPSTTRTNQMNQPHLTSTISSPAAKTPSSSSPTHCTPSSRPTTSCARTTPNRLSSPCKRPGGGRAPAK